VLLASSRERAQLTEQLARLLTGAPGGDLDVLGPDDLDATAHDMAVRRVEEHASVRDELTSGLRSTREQQAVAANRRDEAAARHRRLAAHLTECDTLLEQADELTKTADEAERYLDGRRTELEGARERLALVQEQRNAATRAIEDAQSQLQDLESAELDETTLRRELEKAGHELREAEAAHAESTAGLQAIEANAAERASLREQIAQERAELVARVEAPVYDPGPIHEALAAYDNDIQLGQPDVVAQDLAREWTEVDEELARIESALPAPPSDDDLSTAQHNLAELESIIAELEATTNTARLHPAARDEIEAAHETVLAAEEILDQSGGHPDAAAQLQAMRAHEQQVLAAYGYETYLDLVMSEPEPDDAQNELLEALRARRQAEDTLTSLYAAAEPPQIVLALRQRRERIFREAADLLCCDPGENVAELLYNHPVVPPNRTRDLAAALADYGIYPVGMSARDAAIDFLHGIEREFEARESAWSEIERLDAEVVALDEDDAAENDGAQQLVESARYTAADLEAANVRVETLERELADRTSRDDRRLQRVAAAEQLRAQIAAVTEALERSDEEYHSSVGDAEAATTGAEANLERATAALTDAIRKLRRIAEALPPALRPKPSNDPLGELPLLRETLAGEVERAEVALSTATRDLERARAEIDDTQAQLDAHLTVVPSDDVEPDDLRQAIGEMLGNSDRPAVLDDPFTGYDDDQRTELLDVLASCTTCRPVILLTDHVETLGWAISLPDDVGAVTGLPVEDDEPVTVPARPSTLSDPSGVIAPST
jgi:DNA repair exonuclease SbcCD ATPase subunit